MESNIYSVYNISYLSYFAADNESRDWMSEIKVNAIPISYLDI